LVPIADEVIREARGARGDKPIVMRVESVAPSCLAFVDARRVRQILQNLVGNAVKFTPKGEVVVGIDRDGRWAIVRVRDTGPGIPREEREAIFDEYRQGGDRRSRRRGTGLGLAIARRLAVMHGGTIRLESEVGIGSTFVVRLPVKAAPTRPASSEDPRARAASLPSILEEPDAEVPRSSRRHAGGLS
jgi:signal transduction histidine kinase